MRFDVNELKTKLKGLRDRAFAIRDLIPQRITPRDLLPQIFTAACIVFVAFWIYFWKIVPVRGAADREMVKLARLEKEVGAIDAKKKEIDDFRKSGAKAKLEHDFAEITRRIPSGAEVNDIVTKVREVCRRHSATFDVRRGPREGVPTGPPPATGIQVAPRYRVPIDVTVTSEWAQVGTLLTELRTVPWLVSMEESLLTRAEVPLVQLKLRLATVYTEELPKTEPGAAPAGPTKGLK